MKGTISREDKVGNGEADKLATRGVEMHKVPKYQVEEVERQDALVGRVAANDAESHGKCARQSAGQEEG